MNFTRVKCIDELFEEQVRQKREQVAIALPDFQQHKTYQLTYLELDRRANHLAGILQQSNVQPGTLVALMMERSLELIVAIIGILKAGAVYVPLDPSYPEERLSWMLEDSQCPIIITQSELASDLPTYQAQVICLDRDWGQDLELNTSPQPVTLDSTSLAYINYTSGSTRKPKSVAIHHHRIVRIANTEVYTLNSSNLEPVASGDTGELFINCTLEDMDWLKVTKTVPI